MLHLSDITLRIAGRTLYDKATIALPEGARVGFVARNGAGKTTLFNAIAGDISPESGAIHIPRGAKIGRVAQEAPGGPETLIEVVLAADLERAALMIERETVVDPMRIADIEMRLTDIDAHSAESRAGAILHGLGFDAAAQRRPCSEFSGGWRMRVALAAVLFSAPDLLLLDEPTNYLDLEGTLWLYDYLSRYPRTAVIISHDRELLNESVDHILHLNAGKLSLYRGGYDAFERQRREALTIQTKMRDRQLDERKRLQAFVDRFKATASKARQAQSRVKRLEKMQTIAAVTENSVRPFNFPTPERPLSPPLVAFDGAAAGYGERIVLDQINLSLSPDDRVALLGSNGNGKSTFAKLLTGRIETMKGSIKRSSKLAVAYFAQHQLEELGSEGSPIALVSRRMPQAFESTRRAICARMGFPGADAEKPVVALSGGEKARLLMGLATLEAPHLLVLDEPTNHLDVDSRAALAEALNAYGGAVILITHDRFLVEACADRLWLVADGRVTPFDGDMEDYRRFVLTGPTPKGAARARQTAGVGAADRAPPQPLPANGTAETAAPTRSAASNQKKRLAAAQERVEKLTALIAKVDAALADGSAFRADPVKARDISRRRAELADALASAEEDWLKVGEAV